MARSLYNWFFCGAIALNSLLNAWGVERPASGQKVPQFEPVDKAVLGAMDLLRCSAGTVAISKDKKLLYTRGFGWSDQEKATALPADALMRIASVTKPFTAVAIKNAVRTKKLTLETKAFEYIGIKPPSGKAVDPRIYTITIAQLLEHKGGWDRDHSFDPMFRAEEIRAELQLNSAATPVNVIEYMLVRPLQFAPGERVVYSNFGYCVLGRVLEQALHKTYFECIQDTVCRPLGIKDVKLGHTIERDPREVSYPVSPEAFSLDIMDAHGGLIASAPALCRLLDYYWINGEPRMPSEWGNWTFFGSLPGTTALVRQRRDGYNYAVLLNGRRERFFTQDNDLLLKSMEAALDGPKAAAPAP